MIIVYGTIVNDTHIDTSKTLRGAKIHATINGFDVVTKRTGYNAFIVAKKENGKWKNISLDSKIKKLNLFGI